MADLRCQSWPQRLAMPTIDRRIRWPYNNSNPLQPALQTPAKYGINLLLNHDAPLDSLQDCHHLDRDHRILLN